MRRLRTILVSLLLLLPCQQPASAAATDNAPAEPGTFEQRAATERASRSRYRNLEVGSLVIILAAGGGILFWALRRR